ncbi:ankyrin repeat domain-containing protein [Legionella genomosp. 1]|uniref:ankyrin repeat domain-containing protein n=1 Tax=Legionella genomosp. 1 TaxID=1093625 RepID=UPI00105426AC|nr:ankyrin repeat domain-containing protein [Legionella genomosp. 1]
MSLFDAQTIEELQIMLQGLVDKTELSQKNSENQTPIVYFASRREWDKVRALLDVAPISADDANLLGREAVLAARTGNMELAINLLKIDNVSRSEQLKGWTILHCAVADATDSDDLEAQAEAIQQIQTLHQLGVVKQNCNQATLRESSPIFLAAMSQKWYLVDALLNEFNTPDDPQQLAEIIIRARTAGQIELAQKILNTVQPNTKWLIINEDGSREISLLHLAILRNRQEEIARLAQEVDLRVKTARQENAGMTALQLAVHCKDWSTVELLTQHSTDPEDSFQYGTAMLYAADNEKWQLAIDLAQKGAQPTWHFGPKEDKLNSFHIAILKNQDDFLTALIANQINRRADDTWALGHKYQNRTPIELAVHSERWDLLPLFAKIKPADPVACGYVAAYEAAKNANILAPEDLEVLREAAKVPKELAPEAEKKDSPLGEKSADSRQSKQEEDARFVEAFKKIYQALYKGQSSWLKSANFLEQHDKLTRGLIEQHISAKPNCRSKKAAALAETYKDDINNIKLVQEIHSYSLDRSGFFSRTKNGAQLNSDQAQEAIDNADENSRLGQIRIALR